MPRPLRTPCLVALAALAVAMPTTGALAQPYPSKPIRIVVAYPPGGISDVVARALAQKISDPLGVPVVVENRAGAGGAIGVDAVAKSAPDGYTLAFSALSPLVLSPHVGHTPYDALKDVVPVVEVMYAPVVLVATTAFPVASLREAIDRAKAAPGAVRWATSGLATVGHVTLEQVKAAAGVDITHVPYKGGGQQLTDALSAQFDLMTTNVGASLLAQIAAGKLKPLAVGAPKRVDSLPGVPTFAELGYPRANLTSTFGIFAPGGTPEPVVARLNAEINKALADPEIRERMIKADNVPSGGPARAFAQAIAQEFESYGRIVRSAGIKAE
jgi:tripartite-type tricarboxylate transporter receptor subunit TctC